jgi:hypothetical protein
MGRVHANNQGPGQFQVMQDGCPAMSFAQAN